jgi:hypothetical protein
MTRNSDNGSDGDRRLGSNKRPKSGHRSRRQGRKLDRSGANEDEEHEVEIVLKARCYHGEL